MSATDPHTKDPAVPHHSENMGHETSDFTWTTVMWLVPFSVVALIAFTLVCLYWFRGAKDTEVEHKSAMVDLSQLELQRAKENEILNGYRWVDKDKGVVRIPVAKAMELIVGESGNAGGLPWKPISDVYQDALEYSRTKGEPAGVPAAPAAPQDPHHGEKKSH